MGRVTDAKFEEGEEREVTTRRGVRGGEVERKIQRCWGKKLTDAAMELEMQGERWVVRVQGLAGFLCIWMWNEAGGVGAAEGGDAELGG